MDLLITSCLKAKAFTNFGAAMTSIVPTESIVNKIVFLRGEKVLLDHALAELYGVETK